MNTIIVFPPTARHLGLFDDLEGREDVVLFEAGYKETGSLKKIIRKMHLSGKISKIVDLPNKNKWFRDLPTSHADCILILDGALNYIERESLAEIRSRMPSVRIVLLLINALGGESPTLLKIRKKILEYPWDEVLTFDPKDAVKYGLTYKGFCYYSKHRLPTHDTGRVRSDLFFIGGVKGGREDSIVKTFDYLSGKDVKCDFRLMSNNKRLSEAEAKRSNSGLSYYPAGWKPYEEVLSGVSDSKCILEVLQNNQSGPSLRYFEAVCYNKMLLTNNPIIVSFPYYDPRYMKIFQSPEDIDTVWLKSNPSVEYNYKNEFSPVSLIRYLEKIV